MTESLEGVFKLNTQLSLDDLIKKIKNVQTPLTDCFLIIECITPIQILIEPYPKYTELLSYDQIKINLEDTQENIKIQNPKIYITYNEALNFEEKDLHDMNSHFLKSNFYVKLDGNNGFEKNSTKHVFKIVSFEKLKKTCQQKQEDIIQTREKNGWTLAGQENDLSSKLKSFTETIEINNAEIAEIDREILTIQEELELESISEEEKPKLEEEKTQLEKKNQT